MFVYFLLFVLPFCQATESLDSFLNTFVAKTALDFNNQLAFKAEVNPLAVISASSDKAAIAATIMGSLYGVIRVHPHFVPMTSEDVEHVEAALEDGATVVAVNWELNNQKATTYAIVSSAGILESVTKTYTKPAPVAPTDAKLHPEQFVPTYASKYHSTFLDGFDTPAAAFDAEVKCTAAPSCSLTASCVDARPFCKCLYRSRVECAADKNKCFGEVAFVGYCGDATIGFDEKGFKYIVNLDTDFIYHNAYVKLEKACACRPPK